MLVAEKSAVELLAMLADGDLTATELTGQFIERIESQDAAIGAFLRVDRNGALEQAQRVDERRGRGESLGPLAGLPVAIKDLLATRGDVTTCASRMLEQFRPPYDATAIRKLREADAVLIGKTNLDEFAMGGSTENSAFQPTHNPWCPGYTPGGSSGGSAAAVAASMAPLAVGTDTGGSIRQPAAFCGVTGMKPTYGRVSRYGLVAFASSLDQIGPIGHSAEDAALLLEVLAGHDPADSTSVPRDVPSYRQTIGRPLEGLRLGVIDEHLSEGVHDDIKGAVEAAIDIYRELGATIEKVSLPHTRYSVATYYVVAPSEASSNLARYDGVHYGYRADEQALTQELEEKRQQLIDAGHEDELDELDSPLVRLYRRTRSEGFGSEVKRRIMIGTYALSAGYYDAYYLKALKVRRLISDDYRKAFGGVDLLIGPVTPVPAFPLGDKMQDPLAMYLVDLFTAGANLAGVPGISIPCGFTSDGLPIGLQLQAPPFEEERLLRGAHMFQQATDWHLRRPEPV